MVEIGQICREQGLVRNVDEITADNFEVCYNKAMEVLVQRAYGKEAWRKEQHEMKRYTTNSYVTYCNKLKEMRQAGKRMSTYADVLAKGM
eukprot:356336-Hanusia_phi.AAC.1